MREDQAVQGCCILGCAPLSINLPCLSHHFDQTGALSFQSGIFSSFLSARAFALASLQWCFYSCLVSGNQMTVRFTKAEPSK